MENEHLNEFINPEENRIKFLTGFTGTAGTAITSVNFNGLLTDGRYYSQATKQLTDYKLVKHFNPDFLKIIKDKKFKLIGIDPHFISYKKYKKLKKILFKENILLLDVPDLVNQLRGDQKKQFNKIIDLEKYNFLWKMDLTKFYNQLDEIADFDLKKQEKNNFIEEKMEIYSALNSNLAQYKDTLAGNTFEGKLGIFDKNISETNNLSKNTINTTTSKKLEKEISIINQTPVFESSEIIKKENITGSTRAEKIAKIRSFLKKDEYLIVTELDTISWIFNLRGSDIKYNSVPYSYAIITHDRSILFISWPLKIPNVEIMEYEKFEDFIKKLSSKKVVISSMCNAYIANQFKIKRFTSQIRKLQSIKTQNELYGMLESNIIDAISLLEAYGWLMYSDENPTEKEICEKIDDLKKRNINFLFPSFKNAVGIGKNAGDLHHENSDAKMDEDKLVLIDSGSQYLFGTTDITRTLCRQPTKEMKEKYTAVLKAVIAAKMFNGVLSGVNLDKAARDVVNKYNFDYDSATGHGIGSGLFVHESPPSIAGNGKLLQERHVFSIEPGYYNTKNFGVRIEDDVFLDKNKKIQDLTFLPYHISLIDASQLSLAEKEYINRYNKKTRAILDPIIKSKFGRKYLFDNTINIE